MKTINEIMRKATVGDILTDGKREWKVVEFEGLVGVPTRYTKNSFEIWADCALEKVAIIPNLRIKKK